MRCAYSSLLDAAESAFGPAVWDTLGTADLSAWLPHKKGHCQKLNGLQAKEARQRFAMSPLWISSLTCAWGGVPEDSALKARDGPAAEILICLTGMEREARELRAKRPCVLGKDVGLIQAWPQPRQWVARYLQDSAWPRE